MTMSTPDPFDMVIMFENAASDGLDHTREKKIWSKSYREARLNFTRIGIQ